MKESDKIEVIVGILSDTGRFEMAEYLMKMHDSHVNQLHKYYKQLEEGRDYLMQVEPDEITVENSLEAFGFGKNGLDNRP